MTSQVNSYSLQLISPVKNSFLEKKELFEQAEKLYGPFEWGAFNPDNRFEMSSLEQLLAWLSEQTGDRKFHLTAAENLEIGLFGPVSYYLLSCSSLAEFFVQFTRLQELLVPRTEPFTTRQSDMGLTLELKLSHNPTPQAQLRVEYLLACMFKMIQAIAGPQCRPVTLELPWSSGSSADDLHRHFGADIVLQADKVRCIFESRWIFERLPNSNPSMMEILRPEIDRMLLAYQKGTTLVQKIYEHLIRLDSLSGVTLNTIARHLAMSESTLKRRLTDEDATFKSLVTHFRQTRTLELLGQTSQTFEQISQVLGFSERASFERAFKSWYGLTPSKFRNLFRMCTLSSPHIDLNKGDSLPGAPGICREVVEMLSDEEFQVHKLVELIRRDPVLTGKIIGLANSAFYGSSPVIELETAIIKVLGSKTVMHLAIAMIAGSELTKKGTDLDIPGFWAQSLLAAWWTEKLAGLSKMPHEEVQLYYLVALLAQIGNLLLGHLRPAEMKTIMPILEESLSLQEQIMVEQRAMGINRFDASAVLLAHWQLPGAVIQNIQGISGSLRKLRGENDHVRMLLAGLILARNINHPNMMKVFDQVQIWFPVDLSDVEKQKLVEESTMVIPSVKDLASRICA